jgi:hypothetical protein
MPSAFEVYFGGGEDSCIGPKPPLPNFNNRIIISTSLATSSTLAMRTPRELFLTVGRNHAQEKIRSPAYANAEMNTAMINNLENPFRVNTASRICGSPKLRPRSV